MPTIQPLGCGAPPSAVILSFPSISPKMRAAALFAKAVHASVFGDAGDDLAAFDAVIGEAIAANAEAPDEMRRLVGRLEASEAILAASVDRVLAARERGAIRPLAAADVAALRAYLDRLAGEEVAG